MSRFLYIKMIRIKMKWMIQSRNYCYKYKVMGVLMMEGGVAIVAAGSIVGAVGVSGAPGGDKDELCARAGVESVQERLDFADWALI